MKSHFLLVAVICVCAPQGLLAQTQQVKFNFVGRAQTWVVPNNVTSISIDALGAQGGGNGGDPKAAGGKGGRVQTALAVRPGETLVISVGGRGGDLASPNTAGPGGFNGGGAGGIDNVDFNGPASGGGGASDIRQGGDDLAHRVVVAGGGGGAECCEDANGGDGGGPTGMAGAASVGGGSTSGGGGTPFSGGLGGGGCNGNGTSGSLGQGGIGGDGNRAGGGGGGGYFGGGGGGGCFFGAGGGGGSSFSAGMGTVYTQGDQTGDGQVVISFSSSPPATTYTVTDLGTLPGGSSSFGHGINAAGHVTGYATVANGDTHPFLWTPSAGMVDIAGSAIPSGGGAQGFWINNFDQIVGAPEATSQQAFFYNGTFSYLSGTSISSAKGINDSGQIAGHTSSAHASVWLSSTAIPLDIDALAAETCGTATGNSDVSFISNAGLVAGHVNKHAFLYNIQNGQVTCIPTPGPQSIAGGINNLGQVAVSYFDPALTFQQTLIWSPNQPPITIPTINGFTRVIGGIINDAGQVVGQVCTLCADIDSRPFLYSGGVTYDLNNLIPPGSGWVLQGATAINNAGSIVGYGLHNGQTHAFLLQTQLPPTPPLTSTIGSGNSTSNPTTSTHDPINTATGNYFLSRADLVVPGKGLPFTFSRSYNSLDSYSGPLGAGWTHSFNVFLTVTGGTVTIKEADGHQVTFASASGGVFTPSLAGVFDALNQNTDGTFTLTRKNQVKFNFSAEGRLTSIVDRNSNTQALSCDGSGNLTSVADTSGRTFTLAYDGGGRVTSLSDPVGRVWQYAYDANGNLISVRDAAGGIAQYAYDGSHRMTSAIDPRGVTFLQNTYDSLGRVATQTNGRGFVTTLAYNSPAAGITTFTDPLGNSTKHVYDAALRLIGVIDANGGTVSYTYDANNDRTSITNQNGNTTNLAYDAQGNVASIIDPLGNTQAFSYDAKNDLLTATTANGATTVFTYDSNGNLTNIRDALGDTTSLAYTSGLLSSKTDPRGNISSYAYDAAGDLVKVTDPLGNATNMTYDGVGRFLLITDANGHTSSVTYDPLSRIAQTKDALSNSTQFVYDGIGNLLKITDANGNATAYAYDGTNNLGSVTDAMGNVTTYGYDANNNRSSFKNANGYTTAYTYDPLNRLAQIADPLSFVTAYAYDGVGNTVSTTDANGKTNQYSYDVLNRLTKGSFADGSSVAYTYDKDGNRVSMTDARGTTNYSYDTLDRLISVASPGGTLQYGYDAANNRTSLVYSDARSVQYQYDALNRLKQVEDWVGKATGYAYDPAGNLTGFSYPNGAASAYTYDAANRLLQIVNRSGNQVLSSFNYALDNVGNRMQVTSSAGGVTKFGYDSLYRLTSWTPASGQVTQYNYDPVGNRLSMVSSAGTTGYSYDADDRLLMAGTTSYTYDRNGNQITKTTGSTTVNYTYDALNQLTAAAGGGINSKYQYDGDGNRVGQTTTAGSYEYLNDTATGLPVILNETGPDGNIDYLYGSSLISETSPAFQYFYQSDGLGSAASLTDAIGALKANYTYDPWGRLITPIDPLGARNKYKFTGEELDPGTGIYYLRARYYDPTAGRFISKDSFSGFIMKPGSLNRFIYGLNNPVRFTDPSGFFSLSGALSFVWNATGVAESGLILSAVTAAQGVVNLTGVIASALGGPGVTQVSDTVNNYVATVQHNAAGQLVSYTAKLENVTLSDQQAAQITNKVVPITDVASDIVSILAAPSNITDFALAYVKNGGSAIIPILGALEGLGETVTSVINDWNALASSNPSAGGASTVTQGK